ncbi:MAG: MFS transporter [Chitinophagaceae bacterium]|nr:MFS transporter [Chitinophagaceae bacterium]MCA6500855.1 MFS transporter [Chitinophagaceae bacterium]
MFFLRLTPRISVSLLFFAAGLTFASWASRIPDVQQLYQLGNGALGAVLFALPAGSLVSLPLWGWMIAKYGSKKMSTVGLLLYPVLLCIIPLMTTTWQLWLLLFLFGMTGNLCNIAINTQAVGMEKSYDRSIMATFHAIWSLAGFTGAFLGNLLISWNVSLLLHFGIIAITTYALLLSGLPRLIKGDGGAVTSSGWVLPGKELMLLGCIAFCCMACEGTMFDWSGVYFQHVLQVPKSQVALGYAAFMSTMAGGRFLGDWFINRLGNRMVLRVSGLLITSGLLLSVLFPALVTATIGFMLVGLGVSSVIPVVYSNAGKSADLSPSVALATVSSIGFIGFLIGPPIIGFIAEMFSLRWSFTLIALLGLGTTFFSGLVKLEK